MVKYIWVLEKTERLVTKRQNKQTISLIPLMKRANQTLIIFRDSKNQNNKNQIQIQLRRRNHIVKKRKVKLQINKVLILLKIQTKLQKQFYNSINQLHQMDQKFQIPFQSIIKVKIIHLPLSFNLDKIHSTEVKNQEMNRERMNLITIVEDLDKLITLSQVKSAKSNRKESKMMITTQRKAIHSQNMTKTIKVNKKVQFDLNPQFQEKRASYLLTLSMRNPKMIDLARKILTLLGLVFYQTRLKKLKKLTPNSLVKEGHL